MPPLPFTSIRCCSPARELRLHLLPGPAWAPCLPHSASVTCARTRGPTRGHCSLRAIVPTSAWPRPAARRVWDPDRRTQGGSRTAPCRPGANHPISQGNERGALATAAGPGAAHAFLPGPRTPGQTDPRRPALRPQRRPRPEGGARDAVLGLRLPLGGILPAPVAGPAAPGLHPPWAPPRYNFPRSRGGLRPGTAAPSPGPPTPGFLEHSAGEAFEKGELELGRPFGMSSGPLRRKPRPTTG